MHLLRSIDKPGVAVSLITQSKTSEMLLISPFLRRDLRAMTRIPRRQELETKSNPLSDSLSSYTSSHLVKLLQSDQNNCARSPTFPEQKVAEVVSLSELLKAIPDGINCVTSVGPAQEIKTINLVDHSYFTWIVWV